jgi:NAD-dependent dihydropyrimidine dehydrogenase PreA subunit
MYLEDKMGYKVTVDTSKCNGDGECVDICPVGVYELQKGKSSPINADECLGCESCIEVCPTSAITVEEQ